ncbi:uncharacterized protein I303_107700 [Kwoniella dejecticola CBS 10117]|uniref:Uncharacterized protein n=1 Tax=Kwoniella dejecticola CBS 10117 TaxID=1296121 RepID=A0AAJ8MIW0_9TREE
MQSAPPNTHAGNDHKLTTGYDANHGVDQLRYKQDTPLWKRLRQHSLTQMIFIPIQAFCGPALSDAIGGLGGGGLVTPKTSNVRFALHNGVEAIIIGAATFPLLGSAYYCNSQFNNQWFLMATAPFTGTGMAFWNTAEGASRNGGQLVEGAINLAKNSTRNAGGGISPST